MKNYFAIAALALSLPLGAQSQNPALALQEVDYTIRSAIDTSGNKYIGYAGQLPSLLTVVNADGTVSVCAADEKARMSYVYEYGADGKLRKTLSFKNEAAITGAFAKDADGNYYFFFAESAGKQTENMVMVKYDKNGEKINAYRLAAHAKDSMDGVKTPFDAGTCRLELSGSLLAVYFARLMFNGHQASYGFVLDKDTFERVDNGATTNDNEAPRKIMPYVSHSFNQFIVPVDNGFVFADHGDAYPRCFAFAKFQTNDRTRRVQGFKFPGSTGQNATYAEMGGLAKTPSGFLFAAAYGKSASGARNIFVMTVDENMSSCGAPVYLTSYTPKDGHAAHPKITALDKGRYLVLWELCEFSNQAANAITADPTKYKCAYMLIIDETGKALSDVKPLPVGVRLNMNDTLRYSVKTGNVYWAVNGGGRSFALWAFNPDKEINAAVDPAMFNKPALAEPGDFKYTVKGKKGEAQTVTITKYTGSLTNIIIPDTIDGLPVTVIGKSAFERASLSTVTLPGTLKTIEDTAFWYSNIEELQIPEGTLSIGKQAFSFCASLKRVTLPASLETIKEFAFMSCPALTAVTIHPDNDMQLGYGAFDKCPALDETSRKVIASY